MDKWNQLNGNKFWIAGGNHNSICKKKMLLQMYIDPKQTPQEAQAEVLAMALTAY